MMVLPESNWGKPLRFQSKLAAVWENLLKTGYPFVCALFAKDKDL
jgi:hypothetical protein